MDAVLTIYHENIPDFLREFAATPPMERIRSVGMNCGCEYTNFPRFRELLPYSRYDHSLGAALIVWHFTHNREQALAALFHDVTTPVFAHVVDFLNGDHLRQESTEAGVAECLAASREVCALLEKYGIALEDIADYHRYPIADNDSPALSADRLEYTIGNLYNYGFADLVTLRGFYNDLTVGTDERGVPELVFRTPAVAADFALAALNTARVYVADEDRFAMESLAILLRQAVERGVLTMADLWRTEPEVIAKLLADPVCAEAWRGYRRYSCILRRDERPAEGIWLQVNAKKRWIDPLAAGQGRVSCWHEESRRQITEFCGQDFSCWLSAELGV